VRADVLQKCICAGEKAGSTGFAGEKGDGIRSFVRFEHAQMPWRKCYELAQRERQT
jgi:hypothetical protein